MGILEKEQLSLNLFSYYEKHYGKRDTDIWFEQPAVNVWVFKRGNKIITLKSHVITGDVSVFEQIPLI